MLVRGILVDEGISQGLWLWQSSIRRISQGYQSAVLGPSLPQVSPVQQGGRFPKNVSPKVAMLIL